MVKVPLETSLPVKQDRIDILRQEYADFNNIFIDLPGERHDGPFSLPPPYRLAIEIGNPYASGLTQSEPHKKLHSLCNKGKIPIWYVNIIPNLVQLISTNVRSIYLSASPIFGSGYRCPIKNWKLGASRDGPHCQGRAVDYNLEIDGISTYFPPGDPVSAKRRAEIFADLANKLRKGHNLTTFLYGCTRDSGEANWSSRTVLNNTLFVDSNEDTISVRVGYWPNFSELDWPVYYGKVGTQFYFRNAHTDDCSPWPW